MLVNTTYQYNYFLRNSFVGPHLHREEERGEQVCVLRARVDVDADGEEEEDALEVGPHDGGVEEVPPPGVVLLRRLRLQLQDLLRGAVVLVGHGCGEGGHAGIVPGGQVKPAVAAGGEEEVDQLGVRVLDGDVQGSLALGILEKRN